MSLNRVNPQDHKQDVEKKTGSHQIDISSTGENRHTWKWLFQILGSNRTRQPAPEEMKTGVDGSGFV